MTIVRGFDAIKSQYNDDEAEAKIYCTFEYDTGGYLTNCQKLKMKYPRPNALYQIGGDHFMFHYKSTIPLTGF